jgi:hypothetical protein
MDWTDGCIAVSNSEIEDLAHGLRRHAG